MTQQIEQYTLSNGNIMPSLGFGTYLIPAKDTKRAVLDALKAGYRHIDTAQNYDNEAEVGQAIHESGLNREDIFVTTKLTASTKTYQGALDDFEQSMARLDIDYVDLYLIHAPEPWDEAGADYDEANREVWKAMEKIYKSGRAKAIGVSNFNRHDLENILTMATVKPMVDQIQYYIGYTQPDITVFAKQHNMLIEAFTPLARGALADNPLVEKLAAKYSVSFAQLALRYCLQTGTVPLAKATTHAHMVSNLQLDFDIAKEDIDTLNKVQDHSDIWHFE